MVDFIKKHKEKVNSLVYIVSSIATFGLALLINVIMTNYSSDVVYGQYKYATNFILTIPAIFSFGITWSCASLLARNDVENKDGIVTSSVVSTVAIGVIVTVFLYIINGVTEYYGISFFDDAVIVFPFITAFLLQKLVNQIYTGMGQAVKLSIYGAAPNVIVFIGMLLYVSVNKELNYTYAILLYLFSYVIVIIPKLFGIKYKFTDMKGSMKTLFTDVKSSGFKVHLSSIFTTSSTQIIALVCGNIYGYAEYGYYSLAASLATIFQLIGSSWAVVNFKHYANATRIEKKDFAFMLALGGTTYILMLGLIDIVFFWFYPDTYAPTIFYLKVLCFSNLIYGFTTLFNRFFIGKGLGGKVMKNSFITATATVVVDIPIIKAFGMRGMAAAAVIVSFVCLAAYIMDYISYRKNVAEGKGKQDCDYI